MTTCVIILWSKYTQFRFKAYTNSWKIIKTPIAEGFKKQYSCNIENRIADTVQSTIRKLKVNDHESSNEQMFD
jgi:hypothetical protein